MRAFDPEVAAMLEELRAGYARRLPDLVGRLEGALLKVMESPGDGGLAMEAYRLAHSLVGSSGTYGFSGVCQAASTMKSLVRSVVDGAAAVDGTFRSRAAAVMAILRRAAGKASSAFLKPLNYPLRP